MEFKLYRRANGTFGVRNRIAVIPCVACVNHVAELIASASALADAYTHPYGCDQLGEDLKLSRQCLYRMGVHPNVGAVLVVGLGCEEILPHALYEQIHAEQPYTELIVMQELGGTTLCVERGREILRRFESQLLAQQREAAELSDLVIGVECGGSDFTSGIAANPSVGFFTETVSQFGRIVFGETTELMGAEETLEASCADKKTWEFVRSSIKRVEDVAISMHCDLRGTQPSPGNIAGGLTTIEEKSLGGVCKIGRAKIMDAIPFGQTARARGVTFVDTPGNDMACSLGLAAAGAQIILFTSGRGTPMGFAAAPVIKITANRPIAQLMQENIDVDLSSIVDGDLSIEEGGQRLYRKLLEVALGKETASERLGHREFSLYRISPILT